MSMISRRALFGIGAGAAAATVVPASVAPAEIVVGLDFGSKPAAVIFTRLELDLLFKDVHIIDLSPRPRRLVDTSEFRNVERCA